MFILLLFLMFQNLSKSLTTDKVLKCPIDQFSLEGMNRCHPHLTCKEISSVKLLKRIGLGAVKEVFLVNWNNLVLAMSVPVNKYHLEDFLSGVQVLKLLNPSKHIVQFVGYCEQSFSLLTEFHPLGNAADFFKQVQSSHISLNQGLNFCHHYASILKHLHHGPAGIRVFCDSNSLEKLLSQLLVSNDLFLVLNDVDAVPEVVNDDGIKCGHREIKGQFVAPEQLWSAEGEFNDNIMLGYNEKTDVWKAPTVCEYMLKLSEGGEVLRYRLFEIHAKCKNHDPAMRPTSQELEKEYGTILKEFENHSEL